ncbi:MAG: hypothetical protein QXF17_01410 [Ignisphaera sp.]
MSVDVLTAIISLLIAIGGTAASMYFYFKSKLHAFRKFVDELDDALYDDKISEDEFRSLWERFKALIS